LDKVDRVLRRSMLLMAAKPHSFSIARGAADPPRTR